MAPLSLLLSFIGKKIGTILQAIFGWSITALFGRLDGKRQMAVTVALVLSLGWPLFVVGCFFPGVASWAVAFLPIQHWISSSTLRIVWIALAVAAPMLVGAIVHAVAPGRHGSWPRAIFGGYLLAIGFFIAFLITAFTVPLVKLMTVLRGWKDTHVFVQPREGHYADVVRTIAEAAARAGKLPEVVDAPSRMTMATDVLRRLSRATIEPILADQLRLVRADDVEAYVYPADLLLRGEPTRVARVRAMMLRTELDRVAYLVGSDAGKRLQDELMRLGEVIARHEERGDAPGRIFANRLREVWRDLNDACLPFEDWVTLETLLRRLERRFAKAAGAEALILDQQPDGLAAFERAMNDQSDVGLEAGSTQPSFALTGKA
jgi:hypothetical protein